MPRAAHLNIAWRKYQDEIEACLRETDPDYRERVYIKPLFWIHPVETNPEKYPKLAALTKKLRKRYVSQFLMDQGRVSRSPCLNARVWMLKEAVFNGS